MLLQGGSAQQAIQAQQQVQKLQQQLAAAQQKAEHAVKRNTDLITQSNGISNRFKARIEALEKGKQELEAELGAARGKTTAAQQEAGQQLQQAQQQAQQAQQRMQELEQQVREARAALQQAQGALDECKRHRQALEQQLAAAAQVSCPLAQWVGLHAALLLLLHAALQRGAL